MPSLDMTRPLTVETIGQFYEAVAELSPAERAGVFTLIVRELEAAGVRASQRNEAQPPIQPPALPNPELAPLLIGVARQLQTITKTLVELAGQIDGADADVVHAAIRAATVGLG